MEQLYVFFHQINNNIFSTVLSNQIFHIFVFKKFFILIIRKKYFDFPNYFEFVHNYWNTLANYSNYLSLEQLFFSKLQKQWARDVLVKRCFENKRYIYKKHLRRSAIPGKWHSISIDITLRHVCSSVNLLHISRTAFHNNISCGLLLKLVHKYYQLEKHTEKSIKHIRSTHRELLLEITYFVILEI